MNEKLMQEKLWHTVEEKEWLTKNLSTEYEQEI